MMITLATGIVLIAILWIMIFFRFAVKIWLPAIGLVLALLTFFKGLSTASLIILWVLWGLLAAFSLIKPLRLKVLTQPFLRWFQRQNPPLSAAEQQVIDAGGAWWGNELFSGDPDWPTLLNKGQSVLTAAEQSFLNQQVPALCDLLDEWRISWQDHDLTPAAWNMIKTQGFWALEMEPRYGGHGFSPLAHSAIIGKIASRSISAAITVMVPNSLGPAEFLKYYGTESQKDYYLPRLARGEEVACFALTGIEAGSDAASITDSGVICRGEYEGKSILGVRLNWNKRYITLAPVATLIGLAFRLFDPERLLGDTVDVGITLALVPAHLPGVEQGSRHSPLNMGFMNGPVRGKDVFISLEQLIGGPDRRGQGWQMMMECLVVGRGISLPALATSMAQFCTRMSSAYAQVRRQFHRPIARFESIQQALGRIGGLTYLSEALRVSTIEEIQAGARPGVGSAITKYHLTEFSRQIVAASMDIHAGRSIQLGPRNYLSHLHNAVPVNITVEGANILTRGLIIYGQGVLRCHPYLRNELSAAMNKDVNGFDKIFRQHIGFILSQFSRLIIYGITGGRWIFIKKIPPNPPFSKGGEESRSPPFEKGGLGGISLRHFRQLTRMSNAFAVLTDITLLVLGKRLKIKEALSARLGDVLSYQCMAVAVLKYYQDRGQQTDEKIFMEWGVTFCFGKIQEAIMDFLANFPAPWIARILRRLIFPWGVAYKGPADEAGAAIARALCENMSLRERLGEHCYLSPGSSAWQMEQALRAVVAGTPLLEKLNSLDKTAIPLPAADESYLTAHIRYAYQHGKINQQERDQLQTIADLCWEAIQVDEFQEGGQDL
jgi:acyl-CoA dehydrogenase